MIDYREFIASQLRGELFGTRQLQKKNFNLVLQAFNFFDKNNKGYIDKKDLESFIQNNEQFENHNHDVCLIVSKIIGQVDLDDDGRISLAEFIAAMRLQYNDDDPLELSN